MIKGLQAQRRSEWGFTLIEVMVVIIMIGILAAIAVPIYTGYIYRARASEGVTTLGAIKTYLTERANATGKWPTETEMNTEFNDFQELYYFNKPTLSVTGTGDARNITTAPIMVVTIGTKLSTFGRTADLKLTIDLDLSDGNSNGWSGDVRENWASHLPPIST